MTGSRTIKVLVALIVAMTLGAFTLRLLETRPKPLSIKDLMALDPGADFAPDASLRSWSKIVLHSSAERGDLPSRVHFVIDKNGAVQPTELWRKQVPGTHVVSRLHDYNSDSIGICIRGDFSRRGPSKAQLDATLHLVQNLQQTCGISAPNVFPYSDINPAVASPGRAFPAQQFSQQLLRTR